MNNKTYDMLKYIALIVLPALGTFYFAIAKIWSLPYATEIVGTIAAIDTLLGALLGISSKQYYANDQDVDGYLDVESDDEWMLDLDNIDWTQVGDGSRLHLKIRNGTAVEPEETYKAKH